jgi:hypothetical protein
MALRERSLHTERESGRSHESNDLLRHGGLLEWAARRPLDRPSARRVALAPPTRCPASRQASLGTRNALPRSALAT